MSKTQLNISIPAEWRSKLETIAAQRTIDSQGQFFCVADLAREAIAEKFELEECDRPITFLNIDKYIEAVQKDIDKGYTVMPCDGYMLLSLGVITFDPNDKSEGMKPNCYQWSPYSTQDEWNIVDHTLVESFKEKLEQCKDPSSDVDIWLKDDVRRLRFGFVSVSEGVSQWHTMRLFSINSANRALFVQAQESIRELAAITRKKYAEQINQVYASLPETLQTFIKNAENGLDIHGM